MAFLGSVQSLHMRGALSGAAIAHSCTTRRQTRPAVVPIQAGQALLGRVVSAKKPKTIIVNFDSFSEHPLYRKRVKKTSRIVAHDEDGTSGLGDYVRIVPCKPVSKTKRFKLDEVVQVFEYKVNEETGEVADIGNYESSESDTEAEETEQLGIPAEQLS